MGGHPYAPAKGAVPLVESPFSYFMVPCATGHGGFSLKCHSESFALTQDKLREESLPTGARDTPAAGDTNRVIFVLHGADVNRHE